MNYLRRKLEALGVAVAFAEHGLFEESRGMLNEKRTAPNARPDHAKSARQRPQMGAYRA